MSHPAAKVLIALAEAQAPVPIRLVGEGELPAALAAAGPSAKATATREAFKAAAGAVLLVCDAEGRLVQVLAGLGAGTDPMALRALPGRLPVGDYALAEPPAGLATTAAVAWGLGSYLFDRYRTAPAASSPRLAVAPDADLAGLRQLVDAAALARTMVDTPANDMGPAEIEGARPRGRFRPRRHDPGERR